LLYSLPMLFEMRMSPQLNLWVYGYYPSDFNQEIRDGGFRPMVFMGHGLAVAFFSMTSLVAAAALWRVKIRVLRLPPANIAVYLGGVLILCKSVAPLLYGAVLVPLVSWTSARLQLRIAVIFATIALAYPLLRSADIVPATTMVEMARLISTERANSLQVRFDQDQQLMERASQRPLFGWGRFGRSRIYDEYGKDISLTDGRWTITLGQFGLFGFVAEFGLLALPIFRAASALRYAETPPDKTLLAALALILAINVIELLPNSSLSPWTWLLAGALLGRAEALHGLRRKRESLNSLLSSQPGFAGGIAERSSG
jgi:hypothetical protein